MPVCYKYLFNCRREHPSRCLNMKNEEAEERKKSSEAIFNLANSHWHCTHTYLISPWGSNTNRQTDRQTDSGLHLSLSSYHLSWSEEWHSLNDDCSFNCKLYFLFPFFSAPFRKMLPSSSMRTIFFQSEAKNNKFIRYQLGIDLEEKDARNISFAFFCVSRTCQ